jgi:hypothetical protein
LLAKQNTFYRTQKQKRQNNREAKGSCRMDPIGRLPIKLDKKCCRDRHGARNQHHEPGRAVACIGEGEGQPAIAAALGDGKVAGEQFTAPAARALAFQASLDWRNRGIVRFIGQLRHSCIVAPEDPQT